MALKLYRRHRIECEGGHSEDARTGEFEEGRRGWKRCGCNPPRQTLEQMVASCHGGNGCSQGRTVSANLQ